MPDEKTILFTGGSGLLGKEMKLLFPNALFPTSAEFDVTNFEQIDEYISKNGNIKILFHAAAFTSPPKTDQNPVQALETNIIGTGNVVKACSKHNIKLIYVSTDYVFKGDKGNYKEDDSVYPANKYAWSKLGGECAVRMYDNSIIIRTTFGPNIFPYEKAFTDQWTSRECVKVMAKKIAALMEKDVTGVFHVGGERKTVFEYAKSLDSTKDIKELSIKEISFNVPVDTSLDCTKYNNLVK
ncbi:MAG: sugar nucleotide-binding protein [Candidatus Gracilibacteria bacterium]|jgi:dTDP-4-dehydrorhamnose reductase